MSNELRPCPFCGGRQIAQSLERDSSIVCRHCDVVVSLLVQPIGRGWQQGTRDIWNARANPHIILAPLEWEKITGGFVAETPFRSLHIDGTIGTDSYPWFCGADATVHKTADEAKAAAQAWYEAKIRECLE